MLITEEFWTTLQKKPKTRNNISDPYRLTKWIVLAKTNTVTAIRDMFGKSLTNEEEILERGEVRCSM